MRAFRALLAERVEYACASGRFDRERFRAAGVEEPLRPGETTNDILPLLAAGGLLDERVQRCLLSYLWEEWLYYDTARCGEPPAPSAWQFHFWLLLLEQVRTFPLFPEFAAKRVLPCLLALCDRLTDPADKVNIFVSRYHAQYGQYSPSRRAYASKRSDLLLRILRTVKYAL